MKPWWAQVIDVGIARKVTGWLLPVLACGCGTVTFAAAPPGFHLSAVACGPVLNATAVLLFPQLAGLRVHRIGDTGGAVSISASCTASSGCCPNCGAASARVHGGYSRTVADGAAGDRPVLILLRVLRFGCVTRPARGPRSPCRRDGLASRYCRRSVPLTQMLTGFGLELAG